MRKYQIYTLSIGAMCAPYVITLNSGGTNDVAEANSFGHGLLRS